MPNRWLRRPHRQLLDTTTTLVTNYRRKTYQTQTLPLVIPTSNSSQFINWRAQRPMSVKPMSSSGIPHRRCGIDKGMYRSSSRTVKCYKNDMVICTVRHRWNTCYRRNSAGRGKLGRRPRTINIFGIHHIHGEIPVSTSTLPQISYRHRVR